MHTEVKASLTFGSPPGGSQWWSNFVPPPASCRQFEEGQSESAPPPSWFSVEEEKISVHSFFLQTPSKESLDTGPSVFQDNKLNACLVVAGIASAHYGLHWFEGKCEVINYHVPLARCCAGLWKHYLYSISGHLRRQIPL